MLLAFQYGCSALLFVTALGCLCSPRMRPYCYPILASMILTYTYGNYLSGYLPDVKRGFIYATVDLGVALYIYRMLERIKDRAELKIVLQLGASFLYFSSAHLLMSTFSFYDFKEEVVFYSEYEIINGVLQLYQLKLINDLLKLWGCYDRARHWYYNNIRPNYSHGRTSVLRDMEKLQ